MSVVVLKALACAAMEDQEAMANLNSVNLTLSQSLTQAQETVLVLSKQLQALQDQSNSKKPTTDQPVMYKKTRDKKLKSYCCTHGSTCILDHTSPSYRYPKIGHQLGATLENMMG